MSDEPDLDAEWHANRAAHRLRVLRAQRPTRLRDEGELDPRIAAWGDRLVAGTAANLILVGDPGLGKTWSAWEVLERAVANGYAGRIDFATAADWQEAASPPADWDRLRAMRAAAVLVMDDFGSMRLNDWQKDLLHPMVDERWANALPIIVTTNMRDLSGPLGKPLASRVKDGATLVVLEGVDRRRGR